MKKNKFKECECGGERNICSTYKTKAGRRRVYQCMTCSDRVYTFQPNGKKEKEEQPRKRTKPEDIDSSLINQIKEGKIGIIEAAKISGINYRTIKKRIEE